MAVTAGYNSSVKCTSGAAIAFTDEATTTSDQLTYSITDTAKQYVDWDTAVVIEARYNERQQVAITGSPTGGDFTLTFDGQTTTGIAYNANAAAVQAALEALSNIDVGDVVVTGGPGPGTAWIVEFQGTKAYANQTQMTKNAAGLTGGSSPDVVVTTLKDGSTWTVIATGFTLYRVYARVVFAAAQATSTQVRFASGKYFVSATVAQMASGDISEKYNTDDTTMFSTTGEETSIVTTFSAILKFSQFHLSSARIQALKNRERLILDAQVAGGDKYAGYVWTTDSNIKSDPKKANREELTFLITDEFYSA